MLPAGLSRWEARKKVRAWIDVCQAMLTSATDRKNNPNRGYSGFGSGTGSRAERVKNEDGSYASSGHRSGGGEGGGGGGGEGDRESGHLFANYVN